jgi:putative endonuclease
MQKTSQTGSSGEYLAQEYLKNKNYTILFINWRHKRSEIDIIAQDGKVIVFVEVKTRTNLSFGHPENFVDANKN